MIRGARCIVLILAAAPLFSADWNPRLAANYLDSRQQAWAEWPKAKAKGGTCVSCHTGAIYFLARPALARVLGEKSPAPYQIGLLDSLRARLDLAESTPGRGVESIFAALFLSVEDGGSSLSPDTRKAFDRLWALQVKEGPSRGAWPWYSLNLDPYEEEPSGYFGAALAATAVASAPAAYREQPDVRARVMELNAYLQREMNSQPLHNRLALLWTSAQNTDALPLAVRKAIMAEALGKQSSDGGWTLASIGPWKEHTGRPVSEGSNAYATAIATVALSQALPRTDAALMKAMHWLESHQDREGGYWDAVSMNKKYPDGSMESLFMRDAATAFAVLALARTKFTE